MAKQTLNLGAVLSDILKNSNSNFTELYDAIAKIQEKIADDGEKAIVYSTVDKMIAGLNAGTDEVGKALDITIGDEIYILDDETPDFWVSAVSSTSTTGTKPASWEKGVNYSFGKYTIRVSKSREIDLADYQKIANMDTGSALGSDVTKDRYPSSFTVYSWVTNLLTTINSQISTLNSKAHTHGNKDLLDTYKQTESNLADAVSKKHSHANKALLDTYDQTNDNIKDAVSKKHSHSNKSVLDATTASYTTEEKTKLGNIDSSLEGVTADEIGKVKDVTVNGTSVLDDDGTAKIAVDDLEGELEMVQTTDSRWATKGGNHCLKMLVKDDLHFVVYNSNGNQLVTQEEISSEGGQFYAYINFGATKPTYPVTLRKIKGNAVGTSGSSSLYNHYLSIDFSDADNDAEGIIFATITNTDSTAFTPDTLYDYFKTNFGLTYLSATGVCYKLSETVDQETGLVSKETTAYPICCVRYNSLTTNLVCCYAKSTAYRLSRLDGFEFTKESILYNGFNAIVDTVVKV